MYAAAVRMDRPGCPPLEPSHRAGPLLATLRVLWDLLPYGGFWVIVTLLLAYHLCFRL